MHMAQEQDVVTCPGNKENWFISFKSRRTRCPLECSTLEKRSSLVIIKKFLNVDQKCFHMNKAKKHTYLPCNKIDFSFKRPSPSQITIPTANIFSWKARIIICTSKNRNDDDFTQKIFRWYAATSEASVGSAGSLQSPVAENKIADRLIWSSR
jgi:hypothetical protein